MIRPSFLKPGDTVGIVAPAGCLAEPEITDSVDIIRSWQLEVAYGKYLFNRRSSFAGTDRQRAVDFQQMLNNRNIKAILCARGGYGTIRMIDKLNFASFLKHPKWIAGFSDITVLHACMQQCLGVESLHGAMPRVAPPGKPDLASMDSLRAFLFGEIAQYTLQPHHLNMPGKGKGILVGGNLSVLYSLAGSCFDPDTRGKILFLEDLNEYLYHVDRMVMSLKIREKLKGLSGLIIGNMTGMKSSSSGFRKPAYEIILDAVAGYGYPVMFGFPAGHSRPNYTLPLGREVKLSVTPQTCSLKF
ncbi:MAG: LD-carboxypeptidase [Bacteroidales bacterium]